ncbi:MAG: MBL fold metallo-hydrolase [Candidatus Latescibacterota bacterium]
MRKVDVAHGLCWVEAPEADLRILCGCPADAIKHLIGRGLVRTEERNGVTCETGPNAILLSDVPVQNERLCNLAEFPVLQMLYRQGMLLPGHPNNTGARPLLMGLRDQVEAQLQYLHRGNYGLASVEEITAAGVPESTARDLMRVKLRFAFGRIRSPEELVEALVVADEPVGIRGGVYVQRQALNRFRFCHHGQALEVDLNLRPGDDYEPPYDLPFQQVRREYFSVVHCGEGDGWDPRRPCMSSIVVFQGRIYLVDTGPNIRHTLQALGISVSEIDGVFQTHAHDDHFNGLPVLMRSDHRLRYYATPLVRESVMRKLEALTALAQGKFHQYFEVHDLQPERWNQLGGLEVKPVVSPHPVETTVLFFRALWDTGYRTYAHLADLASFEVLHRMVTTDPAAQGLSPQECERVTQAYLAPVDLKKIDAGGGLIHGSAEDFRGDASRRLVLSHTSSPLQDAEKEVGSSAAFGAADVLIAADHDYSKAAAFRFLRDFHPTVPEWELHMLLNCPAVTFGPGSLMVRKGSVNQYIYLTLSGLLEFVVAEAGVRQVLAAGSLAGELSGVLGTPARGTYRSLSVVRCVQIPSRLYRSFLRRNRIYASTRRLIGLRRFLQDTWLFGERLSCPTKNRVALSLRPLSLQADEEWSPAEPPDLLLLREGRLEVCAGERVVDSVAPGGFCGEERIVLGSPPRLRARAVVPSTGYLVPAAVMDPIPIVQWKLLETVERRVRQAELQPT